MSVGLSILFTGLCALVGDGDGNSAQVLLPDTKAIGQVQGVTLPGHTPTLVVSLNDLANPDTSLPSRVVSGAPNGAGRVDQLGLWDLTGSEVRIRAQGGGGRGLRYFRPRRHETSWPEPPGEPHDPAAWRDLRFVPNMTALVGDGRIDPSLIGNDDGRAMALPRAIAARVHLDAGLIEGSIPSQQTYRDEVFEFGRPRSKNILRQALTDTMHWKLQTDATAIVIDIVPVAGGRPKQLLLAPSARPHRVFVSNLPIENPSHSDHHQGMTDQEMSALHFGVYYALLRTQPSDKPLPELWQSAAGDPGAGGARPMFCAPAVFSRQ
jgi:hypothetical protein